MTPLKPIRRIVSGNNESGRSFIQYDGPAPAPITLPSRPGYCNANLWRTGARPSASECPDDVDQHRGVSPPTGGTVLRVVDFPPSAATAEERQAQAAATFASIYPDARHQAGSHRDPGMHTTTTVDYALVLAGEIVAIMDEDETIMRAGDILVQRGTAHAWANRSGEIARVAFVLIDAQG
jgi:quercetin dioxygenase-like cupin family protein